MVSTETEPQQSLHPKNIGILAIEAYFPSTYVDQAQLETFDGVSPGKYTVGLGQTKMAFCDDREDINSMCLTGILIYVIKAVRSLMEKFQISPTQIGRLEVGTETIIDKSKAVKTYLMQLFEESGNTDIEGIDTTNACYGGTNALFNSINWIESSSWDGRYAIVVAGDIAVYASGSARPTGGAGVIAMLLGPDAPIVFDRGLRASHMEHVYDFYKPELSSEFPEVDGPLTIVCYLRALDTCYQRYLEKLAKKGLIVSSVIDHFDYFCFHSPYTKLVQKSFARIAFNDFLRDPSNTKYEGCGFEKFKDMKLEDTYFDKEVEKAFVNYTKSLYEDKVVPTLLMAKNIGNMYCGSLYASLTSLISSVSDENLLDKKLAFFSFGSGLAASLFSATVKNSIGKIASNLNIVERLESRSQVLPGDYEKIMILREETHNLKNYTCVGNVNNLFPGTYYLVEVDDKYRRKYAIHLDLENSGN